MVRLNEWQWTEYEVLKEKQLKKKKGSLLSFASYLMEPVFCEVLLMAIKILVISYQMMFVYAHLFKMISDYDDVWQYF